MVAPTLTINAGVTVNAGVTLNGFAPAAPSTFSNPTDFGFWILGDSDGSGYFRFQGPFNGSGSDPLGTAFYNFVGTVLPGDSFSATAVISGTPFNISCTVTNVLVYTPTQIDLYYNTVSGDLPFNYGGDSLSVTFA